MYCYFNFRSVLELNYNYCKIRKKLKLNRFRGKCSWRRYFNKYIFASHKFWYIKIRVSLHFHFYSKNKSINSCYFTSLRSFFSRETRPKWDIFLTLVAIIGNCSHSKHKCRQRVKTRRRLVTQFTFQSPLVRKSWSQGDQIGRIFANGAGFFIRKRPNFWLPFITEKFIYQFLQNMGWARYILGDSYSN
jgi:hypothetical protein